MGGNQVTGLSKASTAPGVGTFARTGAVWATVMGEVYDRFRQQSI
jgi:hypothetical protein